jgi:hypothetical protein
VSGFDPELLKAARELKYTDSKRWRQFIADHPELTAEVEKPKKGKKITPNPKPGTCWSKFDRQRRYRNKGARAETSTDAHEYVGSCDTGEHVDHGDSHTGFNGSLLAFHYEMNAGLAGIAKGIQGWTTGYSVSKETTDPDQLEVCWYCGKDLGLPRDDEGFVIRGTGGQVQYCSDYCKTQQDNKRDRERRARRRAGFRYHHDHYGVPGGQVSTGPQERVSTSEVKPWTVPCWAVDAWLKFAVAGVVPVARHCSCTWPRRSR